MTTTPRFLKKVMYITSHIHTCIHAYIHTYFPPYSQVVVERVDRSVALLHNQRAVLSISLNHAPIGIEKPFLLGVAAEGSTGGPLVAVGNW